MSVHVHVHVRVRACVCVREHKALVTWAAANLPATPAAHTSYIALTSL